MGLLRLKTLLPSMLTAAAQTMAGPGYSPAGAASTGPRPLASRMFEQLSYQRSTVNFLPHLRGKGRCIPMVELARSRLERKPVLVRAVTSARQGARADGNRADSIILQQQPIRY